ncbi:heavy metal-associated domain-containing protein [Clostridium perfringens]|uniref:heavy-metal-associated domain-containing protein n=1 Tax=Clostridium perfringens TaxID=1502 RepID=UPI0018E415D4|nr:heavy metal-associated domain-containing protein [Clostridium perfringens]EHK2305955.1 heavy-metal-associated domain-containing protein [Clostridium perfringens]MBI6081934.1 heavy-metal-associated domain-containing protein [Clostridium perfringens]MBI6101910.1 heavy-metal-associated domain-containing protein [Clostridium perfringens]MDK0546917.1 heavy metal-associated domain-containing protein [Clostridium perfringens]MDK0604789.1 heavy metal-associated domain-containing protein [Clostridiu
MSKLILEIDGMSCSNCVRHVEAALLDVDGVEVLEVEVGRAVVDTEVDEDTLRDALEEVGYELVSIED